MSDSSAPALGTAARTDPPGQTFPEMIPTVSRGLVFRVGLISVMANVVLLVLQQIAFKLLAPVIGSSVETWSTIIGVFLAGIALGNVAGGILADRPRVLRSMRWSVLLSAASILQMLGTAWLLTTTHWLDHWPLSLQIAIAPVLTCFLPAFLFSLLTPLAIRSVLTDATQAGRSAGLIYALGTVGSLVGNYLTGFVLIPYLDLWTIGFVVTAGTAVMMPLARGSVLEHEPDEPQPHSPLAGGSSHTTTSPSASSPSTEPIASLPGTQWQTLPWIAACATVFLASFVSGTLESAAFRMLATNVGASIYLSTGVVGVVLAGMALGNSLGGLLAGHHARMRTLRLCLLIAALTTVAVVPLLRVLEGWNWLDRQPLISRILFYSFSLFFVPSLALGTISPQVIRLTVADVRQAGRQAGKIYAWSTAGAIAGILATGWLLIELWGVQRLAVVAGVLLLPLSALVGPVRGRHWYGKLRWLAVPIAAAGFWGATHVKSPYDLETKYYSIQVNDSRKDRREVKTLVLDKLVHSYVDFNDPDWLGYEHEEIQGDFAKLLARRAKEQGVPEHLLIIGGGGYTFPRWAEFQPELKQTEVEVVEIDPGVTETAHNLLGLSRQTRIKTHHLDGRQFVKAAPAGRYQLIVQDAVNDFSVPSHLVTKEYNDLIRTALRPDGVYLLTVIESLTDGPFLRAAVRTMQQSFGEVLVLSTEADFQNKLRDVYIIAGYGAPSTDPAAGTVHAAELPIQVRDDTGSGSGPVTLAQLVAQTRAHSVPLEVMQQILAQDGPRGIILTDHYAPVDRLMSRIYLPPRKP